MKKKVSVLISLDIPQVGTSKADPATQELSVEEKVRAACELIDSGHESRTEWQLIRRLNNYLVRRKDNLTDRQRNVLLMIQPIIEKYGQYAPDGVLQDPSIHTSTRGGKR